MSDQSDMTAAESAETAQSAVEPDTSTTDVPWGDDFTPERAWQTIQNLRGREKELESDAKAFKRLQSDEDAFREFLSQRGFELAENDPEEPEQYDVDLDDDDPVGSQLQELMRRQAALEQREQEKAFATQWNGFSSFVSDLAGKSNVELSDRELRTLAFECEGDDGFPLPPQEAQKVFEAYVAEREAAEKTVIERYLKSKRAPTPPPAGKAGEAQFDRKGSTDVQRRAERQARMAAIIAANDA